MKKLPETKTGMAVDQMAFIEIYRALVEAGVITEEQAVTKYLDAKLKYGQPFSTQFNWSLYDGGMQ